MAEEEDTILSAPPPSYDDVVAAGTSLVVSLSPVPAPIPSAPSFPLPPSQQSTQLQRTRSPATQNTGATARGSRQLPTQQPPRQNTRSSLQQVRPQQATRTTRQLQQENFLEKLAQFNMAGIMLTGVTLPNVNVELDSEAHLPNRQTTQKIASTRKRIKCLCSCLWCCGFTLLFFLVALPVAMLLTGVFGYDSCPHKGNIIIICLIAISVSYFITLVTRLFNSGLSCCKLGNTCNSKNSLCCSACIGIMEGCFIVVIIVTSIIVLLSTWFILESTPSSDSSEADYCNSNVYYAALIMLGLTYLISFCIFIYLTIAAVSYYSYRHELGMSNKKKRRQQNRNPPNFSGF